MKINFIEIKKFRSVDHCKIYIEEINAVVGQNNSGKSAVIRALNAFFNLKDEVGTFLAGTHNHSSMSIPKIRIGFKDINESDVTLPFANAGCLEVELQYQHSRKKHTYKFIRDKKLVNADASLIDAIKKDLAFVYIPPNRSPRQLQWEENALIRKLVEEHLQSSTQQRDTLTPKFKDAAEYLERKPLKVISQEISSLYSLQHDFEFSLKFDESANFLSFLSGIKMHINESGISHHLDECGTGLQSLTIIAIYRALAKLRHQNIILGIEEPEINLHPQAQRELINSIKNNPDSDLITQVILTTHSTVIIDNLSHLDISLVRKESDEARGFKSNIKKLKKTFFENHQIPEFQYYQFHSYRNSDFFFANYVIFTESKNDAEVIKKLASIVNVDLDLCGISIVNIDGVNNLAYPYLIVKELGIPSLVILDKDYFIPYVNDNLDASRDGAGKPKYRYEYKAGILLKELIGSQTRQDKTLSLLKTNHSRAMDFMLEKNVLCMNYNLETDLLCSRKAVNHMGTILNLSEEKTNSKHLLTENKRAIKRISNILEIIDKLEAKNLPNSYKKIKKQLLIISKSIRKKA